MWPAMSILSADELILDHLEKAGLEYNKLLELKAVLSLKPATDTTLLEELMHFVQTGHGASGA